MSSFSFSKVVILQSLKPDDDKTGAELHDFINTLRLAHLSVPAVQLIDVTDKDEFVAAIKMLSDDATKTGEAPILQIETHGWDDLSGLAFSDGSSLGWGALASALSDLNRATGFNLVVCLAACFGGHFVGSLQPNRPSPCFAMIGPTESLYPDELLDSFKSFYEKLLTEREASAALTALYQHKIKEGRFLNTTAEDWFFKVAEGYLRINCSPEELKRRGDAIINEVRTRAGKLTPEQEEGIARIGETLAHGFLNRQFPVFFMTDSIPGNRTRFASSLDAAKQRADALLKTPSNAADPMP